MKNNTIQDVLPQEAQVLLDRCRSRVTSCAREGYARGGRGVVVLIDLPEAVSLQYMNCGQHWPDTPLPCYHDYDPTNEAIVLVDKSDRVFICKLDLDLHP